VRQAQWATAMKRLIRNASLMGKVRRVNETLKGGSTVAIKMSNDNNVPNDTETANN
jgi:hypothetical protein